MTFGDSLVKAGEYARAAEEVYVAYADRNPKSDRAPDALRNAIETYMLADSVARAKKDSTGASDTTASRAARVRALALSERLTSQYPGYKYKVQYQALTAQLFAGFGERDSAMAVLLVLVKENPTWPGRADAMVKIAVDLDSLQRQKESAQAYERFAQSYPKDKRAADAEFNAAVTYLQAGDSVNAARAYGSFAKTFPKDTRAADANAARVTLLRATGGRAAADAELATLCKNPSAPLKADCAARAGEAAFRSGVAYWPKYQAMTLVIARKGNLTKAGVARLSKPKQDLLTKMTVDFKKAIASGSPEWVSAASYFAGLAQWDYANFLANVTLPKDLTDEERNAATAGAARLGEQYYQASSKLWKTLVEKAAQDSLNNAWVDRAKAALDGKVDASPALPGGDK